MEMPKAVVDMFGGGTSVFQCKHCGVVAEWVGGLTEEAQLVCRNDEKRCMFANSVPYNLDGILHVILDADLESSRRDIYPDIRETLTRRGTLYTHNPPFDYVLVPTWK